MLPRQKEQAPASPVPALFTLTAAGLMQSLVLKPLLCPMNLPHHFPLPVEFPEWHYYGAASLVAALVIILCCVQWSIQRRKHPAG
ncbi:MAG TPA: hypothetical protein VG796_06680 [Verrucomicrobiales bacterium]|jgi:hypothetical protein|nr:hypothetical protein [Verrucomicrobiales bacterium]